MSAYRTLDYERTPDAAERRYCRFGEAARTIDEVLGQVRSVFPEMCWQTRTDEREPDFLHLQVHRSERPQPVTTTAAPSIPSLIAQLSGRNDQDARIAVRELRKAQEWVEKCGLKVEVVEQSMPEATTVRWNGRHGWAPAGPGGAGQLPDGLELAPPRYLSENEWVRMQPDGREVDMTLPGQENPLNRPPQVTRIQPDGHGHGPLAPTHYSLATLLDRVRGDAARFGMTDQRRLAQLIVDAEASWVISDLSPAGAWWEIAGSIRERIQREVQRPVTQDQHDIPPAVAAEMDRPVTAAEVIAGRERIQILPDEHGSSWAAAAQRAREAAARLMATGAWMPGYAIGIDPAATP